MEAATGGSQAGTEGSRRELGELLDQETFEPAGGVRATRRWSTTSRCTRRPRADPEAWWAKLAAELDWFTEPETRCSTTPTRRSTSGSPTAS